MEGVKPNTDEVESNTERVEPMVLVGALELCILIVIQIRDSGSSQMRAIDNQFILTVGTPRVKGIQEIDRWRHRVICQAPKNRLEATGSGKILQLGGRCGPLQLGCKLVQSDRWLFWSPQPWVYSALQIRGAKLLPSIRQELFHCFYLLPGRNLKRAFVTILSIKLSWQIPQRMSISDL